MAIILLTLMIRLALYPLQAKASKSQLALQALQPKMKAAMNDGTQHPMEIKKRLAKEIIVQYYDEESAVQARAEFEQIFSKGKLPDDMPEINVDSTNAEINILAVLTDNKLAPSGSEARRLIKQGAVSIDGEKVSGLSIPMPEKNEFVIKVGKRRFLKIIKN